MPYSRTISQSESLALFELALFADNNVKDTCNGQVFGATCDVSCYAGYTPTTAATYECVDNPGETTGKWQAPSAGALVCTGVPCPLAKPLGGSPPKSKQNCPAAAHYSRGADTADPTCVAQCAVGYYHTSGKTAYSCR